MKRKLVLTSAVVLILALLAAGTFAYFSKDARATNVITTGTINIDLYDKIEGGKETADGWTISGVMPGQPVEKIVSVKNTGTSPAWLRVKLGISVTGANGKPLNLTFGDEQDVLTFTTGDGWFYHGGYYYYNAPVAEQNSTADFFAKKDGQPTLMLNPQLPNDYQGCTVTVAVQAQAVQVKNNDSYTDENGETVPIKTLTPENVDKIADTFPAAD